MCVLRGLPSPGIVAGEARLKHQIMRIMYIMLNNRSICGYLAALLMAPAAYGAENALLEKSRQLTVEYATQLQAALQESLKSGGPAAAIGVCAELAPQIASDLSRQSGAKVRRTSLRFRNPGNAPDSWEARALERLESTNGNEIFEADASGGARYLKAITTAGVCLACHGDALAPEIESELATAYPHDRARGFKVGDLRGAFSVSWPAETRSKATTHHASQPKTPPVSKP